jgi:enamine deaminase RidA (YjgF/YER057c/UK114 family)
MSRPEFFVAPGYGEKQLREFHYSLAVRVGNRVETSGQGGWDDDWNFPEALEDETAQAFDNVERTLAMAGASWRDVIHVNSYNMVQNNFMRSSSSIAWATARRSGRPLGFRPWATRRCGSRSASPLLSATRTDRARA